MRRYFIFLLLAIIFASACAGTTETKVTAQDLLSLGEPDVFPSATVSPGQVMTIRIDVKNEGTTPLTFNAGKNGSKILRERCEDVWDLTGFDAYPNNPNRKDPITLGAGLTNTFSWTLNAPTKEKFPLTYLSMSCPMKFYVEYSAYALTTTYIYFANPAELAQRKYTSKELNLIGDNIATPGPVAINFETPEQPVPAYTGGEFTVYFTVKNLGSGTANITTMKVTLPEGIQIKQGGCDLFTQTATPTTAVTTPSTTTTTTTTEEYLPGPCTPGTFKCQNNKVWLCYGDGDIWKLFYNCANYPGTTCSAATGSCKSTPTGGAIATKKTVKSPTGAVTLTVNPVAAKDQLTLWFGSTSRMGCTLKTPTVPSLTPYKFIAQANYTYDISKELTIETKAQQR